MQHQSILQRDELKPDENEISRRTEGQIIQAVRGIRFGSVEIVIQDGRVVQIERKEKIRLMR